MLPAGVTATTLKFIIVLEQQDLKCSIPLGPQLTLREESANKINTNQISNKSKHLFNYSTLVNGSLQNPGLQLRLNFF